MNQYYDKYTKYKHKYINLKNEMTKHGGSSKQKKIIKQIYLIRHGETEWNIKGLSQGAENDICLNDKGVEQSEKTGKYLSKIAQRNNFNFDMILSSPMIRTMETAEIIKKQINFNEKIITNKNLIEHGVGLLGIGKTAEELKKDKFYDDFFEQMDKYNQLDIIQKNILNLGEIPEIFINKYKIESNKKKYERGHKIIKLLEKTTKNNIIVISHNGMIDILNKIILNTTDIIKGDLSNGKNCHITLYHLDSKNNWKLICAPNTLHL